MGLTVEGKKNKSRKIPGKKIPVIPEYDTTPLPRMRGDKSFKPFQEKPKAKRRKEMPNKEKQAWAGMLKSLSLPYERKEQAEKMATDEFRQAMKKPGAIEKYARQGWEEDRSKRILKERQERAKQKGAIQDIMKGKTPYQDVAKGGYIKKYAKGGGVRKVRS